MAIGIRWEPWSMAIVIFILPYGRGGNVSA